MRRVVVLLLAGLLALAGCTSEPKTAPGPSSTATAPTFAVACPSFAARGSNVGAADGLPDLTLPCLGSAGGTVKLAGAPGVPTVVNIWASWCGPCREEAPLLDQLDRAAGGSVRVLGVVSIDPSPSAADAFATDAKLSYPSVLDKNGELLKARSLQPAMPVSLFVDAEGKVVDTRIGPFASYADLQKAVKDKLGVTVP